ncbi:MAG: DUF362 domain-containing protein [Gammaproteobacteria bacterium]
MIEDRIEVNIAGGLDLPLPRMAHVRQRFVAPKLESVASAVVEQFKRPEVRAKIKPGMSIAVGCGSRGIVNIAQCARAVIAELKALGARPFVFPAMGSHGGATAQGQRELLEGYGITEDFIGCPVRSQTEVVKLGISGDMPVYMDKLAAEADGVVVICRVKPHTSFRAPIESGIVKMLTIGMGKITGATELHSHGMDTFGELLPRTARFIVGKKPILFGVAMVENALEQTALLEIVLAEQIFEREPVLLAQAKAWMPRIGFDELDVLIIDQFGKNISGAGMDPNITGRNEGVPGWVTKPMIDKIVVLGLTPESHGNAAGVGLIDVIPMRFYRDIDIAKTYGNVITSAYLPGGHIPIIMNTDAEAIQLAAKCVLRRKPQDLRIVHIRSTLELADIQVSESLLPQAREDNSLFEDIGEPQPFAFDASGTLKALHAH